VIARVVRYFAERFHGVTRSEAWGYGVWGAMGVVVAVPELWAAAGGDDSLWPTISSTVGHLEDRWAEVALAPVALIAVAAFSLLRYRPGEVTVQADFAAVGRTEQGRLARLGDAAELGITRGASLQAAQAGRREWSAVAYFGVAAAVVVAGALLAAQSGNKYLLGYVLYSLIGAFWIAIPSWLAWRHRRDVPFTTLFLTVRCLERRLSAVALLIPAGLAILLVHLALYPWPDLSREPARYAGLSGAKAEELAAAAVTREGLVPRARTRGSFDGRNAWLVQFETARGFDSRCLVAVSETSGAVASGECLKT
jgi:hypothetical protein